MEKESGFYCPYWGKMLQDVTDPEQDQCCNMGKSCELCMEDAEDEDYE